MYTIVMLCHVFLNIAVIWSPDKGIDWFPYLI